MEKIGYHLFENSQGLEFIEVNEKEVLERGYIEVTSNLPLYQDIGSGTDYSVIYVTILTGKTSYLGVLVGEEAMSTASLFAISFTVVIAIVVALLLIFYFLFIRVRKLKA